MGEISKSMEACICRSARALANKDCRLCGGRGVRRIQEQKMDALWIYMSGFLYKTLGKRFTHQELQDEIYDKESLWKIAPVMASLLAQNDKIYSLSREDLELLIKGIVPLSRPFGSVTPIPYVLRMYKNRFPDDEPSLTSWIVSNRVNDYDPFGNTQYNNASSLAEHSSLLDAEREARDQRMQEEADRAIKLRSSKATDRLANAIRRGDVKAAESLIGKCPDFDAVRDQIGMSLQAYAIKNEKIKMASLLESLNIQ
jgi:hypothetical protein